MSLDVSLYEDTSEKYKEWEAKKANSIESSGDMKGLLPLINEYYEDRKPKNIGSCVFSSKITHNLSKMAREAGIYMALWRPEEIEKRFAHEIIDLLEQGLLMLKQGPSYFKKFDSDNGWGTYDQFVPWVEAYLNACREYPDSIIEVSR